MTTKLTLDINETLAEKAKKYAEAHGQSISDLIESLLEENLPRSQQEFKRPTVKDAELVKRILDGTEPIPESLALFFSPKTKINPESENSDQLDYQEILTSELMKKYGL